MAEGGNNRIQKFNSNGTFITKWGSSGNGDGQFSNPTGVAVDSSGNVYVGDAGNNNRIQKFNSNGTFITKWGSSGNGDGQFSSPNGVAVDSSGNVYVADAGNNNRIQKFNSNGTFITKWGSSGNGDGQFSNPTGVAVDSSGMCMWLMLAIITVSKNSTATVHSSQSGVLLVQLMDHFNRQKALPLILKTQYVYVVDRNNNRIQVFAPSSFMSAPTKVTPIINMDET